jgi:FixJ family two-component response regulator
MPAVPGRPVDAQKVPTAFILDDDPGVRAVLARLISAARLRAEVFSAPDALVHRLAEDVAGCLVLDVRMPGLNGLDLYDALVAAKKGLPVVFLSAYLDVSLTVRAMRAGAIDVLRKPWHGPTLVDAVRRGFDADVKRRRALEEERVFQARFDRLTPRERDVMAQVVLGHVNKAIGHDLGMSEKTVKAHRGHLMRKLGARGVADLVRIASRLGMTGDRR